MLSRNREDRPEDLRAVQNVLTRHADGHVGAFGNPIPPPRSSSQLLDSSDRSSSSPSFQDPSVRDLPTRAESDRGKSPAREASLLPTIAEGPVALTESAAGSAATLWPAPRRAKPRSILMVAGLTAAIAGAGLLGWKLIVRAPDPAGTATSATGASPAIASAPVERAPVPSATSALPPPASAGTPPVIDPRPTSDHRVVSPAASASTEARSAQPTAPTMRQGKPTTAAHPVAHDPDPKPSATEIFVAKPPF